MTPIQLASMMATVEGYYYTPSSKKKRVQQLTLNLKHQTTIDKKYFKPMIKGLFDVYNLGQHITGRRN
jgi:penicillin-binding protein 2